MKHNKWIATLAAAGGIFAMTGAAHAIAPAALGAAAIVGAVTAGAAADGAIQQDPPALATAPSTVVMGAPATVQVSPAPVIEHQSTISNTVVVPADGSAINYDHDGDGVLNHNDRFPNDGTRS